MGAGRGNVPPPPPPPPQVPGAPRPPLPAASQPSSSSWTPSISSESLGIGIETEFLIQARELRPESETRKLFARNMSREYNRRDEISKGVGPSMESLIENLNNLGKETHMTWRLVHDPTVETQSAPWGMEVISPILRFQKNSAWRQHVQTLWSFLVSDYRVSANAKCSTHVHVSKAEGYTAEQLKKLAQAVIHFEPAFEALVPPERRKNEYARSNWIDNKNFGYQRLSRQESITVLERCTTVREIVDLMNPDGSKYYGWNFQAIQKYSTVEFRRGAASTSVNDVFSWVELAFIELGVVEGPGLNDKRYFNRLLVKRGLDKSPNARLDPDPVGELTPDKLKKLNQKIRLDQQMNPMLNNLEVAMQTGPIG
ncbi:hypothetical protein INS49_000331 [Diaporthe citri]|uniref:uncharacterized protein n=1 Tax=Diaporthe citri TaxID=83186 RepID=UPI001C8264C0|nr:uncharacterized protein INS49_000331 [Diaporthe citri]KAG6366155.1 hypothetical protein INS49_000331 [Diaporthe citri]